MNVTELQQLAAMEELGSFSEVARRFYVSTPTVTRNMARAEQFFGVALFSRGKNRVELTEAGRLAAAGARRTLRELESSVAEVRAYDRSLRTIDVVSCAPAPLWVLAPRTSRLYPGMSVTTRVADLAQTEDALATGSCDVAVLPHPAEDPELLSVHLMDEHLYLCVPTDHALADRDAVAFADLNGFNFLLSSDLGFWNDIVRRSLPASSCKTTSSRSTSSSARRACRASRPMSPSSAATATWAAAASWSPSPTPRQTSPFTSSPARRAPRRSRVFLPSNGFWQ